VPNAKKDFCGFFDTIEEAKKYIEDVIGDDKNMWGNIADIENKTVIEFSSRDKIWENTDFYNDVEKV